MAGSSEAASVGTIWAGFKAAFPALPVLLVAGVALVALPAAGQASIVGWLQDLLRAPPWLLILPVGALLAAFKGLFYGVVALQLAPRMGMTSFIAPGRRTGGWLGWGLILMATAAIQYVLVTLATMFLVIPGLIVNCILFAAVPAAALERINPGEAMSRSSALTQDYRFGIFGLQLLLGIPMVAALLLVRLGVAVGTGADFMTMTSPIVDMALEPAISTVYTLAMATLCIAFYVRRAMRTSAGAQSVAEVFS